MNPPPPWLAILSTALFVVAFQLIILWGSFSLAAWISGWSALARRFAATEPFEGSRWRFQDVGCRWCSNYGKCVTVGADAVGLFLAPTIPIFPRHPPLFIPWTCLTMAIKPAWWWQGGECLEIRFPELPDVFLRLRKRLAERVAAAAMRPREQAGFESSDIDGRALMT